MIGILVFTITTEITAAAASVRTIGRQKRNSAPRWIIPCGPGHVALASTVSRKSIQVEAVVMEQLQTITRKAMQTKEKVLHLEELYVSANYIHQENKFYV